VQARGVEQGTACGETNYKLMRICGSTSMSKSGSVPVSADTGGEVAEIKRLWICPTARGFGIAKRLMHAAETVARELSVKTLRLDTNSALTEALKLYRTSGWIEIDRFNEDPYPDHFFEKHL
jgi:GNAT superfamily N-acetyltransferase